MTGATVIRIYHVRGTRSLRVIWLCEELGLRYQAVPVDFSAEYRASPEWRRLNPVGKVPVMTDDDAEAPVTIFESGAMVQYLLDRYGDGRLQPAPGTPEHALYLQWSWFAEATLARPLGEIVNHRRMFAEPITDVVSEMADRVALCLQAVGDAVAGRDYLLGPEFGAADVMMGYSLMLAEHLVPERMPGSIRAYWQRLSSRPAYQRAKAVR